MTLFCKIPLPREIWETCFYKNTINSKKYICIIVALEIVVGRLKEEFWPLRGQNFSLKHQKVTNYKKSQIAQRYGLNPMLIPICSKLFFKSCLSWPI